MLTTIEVEINKTKLPVRYDALAFAEVEELTKQSWYESLSRPSVKLYLALAYVGLKCGHKYQCNGITPFGKTYEQVGEWVPAHELKNFFGPALQFTTGKTKDELEKPSTEKQEEKPGE